MEEEHKVYDCLANIGGKASKIILVWMHWRMRRKYPGGGAEVRGRVWPSVDGSCPVHHSNTSHRTDPDTTNTIFIYITEAAEWKRGVIPFPIN